MRTDLGGAVAVMAGRGMPAVRVIVEEGNEASEWLKKQLWRSEVGGAGSSAARPDAGWMSGHD